MRIGRGPFEVLAALASDDPKRVADAVGFQRESFRASVGAYPEQLQEVCPECPEPDPACPLWLSVRQEIVQEEGGRAREWLRREHQTKEERCPACGGSDCDMFMCYEGN